MESIGLVALVELEGDMTPLRKRMWIYGSLLAFLACAWAILAPIFAAARPKSRDATCLSNLKQVALGVLMYVQDYDETMPPARTWASGVGSYTKSPAVFMCPNAGSPYGYGFGDALSGLGLVNVPAPAETVLLFEADAVRLDTHGGSDRVTREDRHLGGLSWAFADSHVKWLKRGAEVRWKP